MLDKFYAITKHRISKIPGIVEMDVPSRKAVPIHMTWFNSIAIFKDDIYL